MTASSQNPSTGLDRRNFIISAASGIAGAVVAGAASAQAPGAAQAPAAQAPAAPAIEKYSPMVFENLKGGFEGLSAGQLEEHLKLYNGYVNRTNALIEKLAKMTAAGTHVNDQKAPVAEYSELKRRFGFEFNGMVLHEYYFENLKKNGGDLAAGSALAKAAERWFGSVQNWWDDFKTTAKSPGIGWVVCCQDPRTKRIINSWVSMHEEGNVAGYHVVLALDLWEHAFVGDYKATERGKYLAAFEKNVDWDAANRRMA